MAAPTIPFQIVEKYRTGINMIIFTKLNLTLNSILAFAISNEPIGFATIRIAPAIQRSWSVGTIKSHFSPNTRYTKSFAIMHKPSNAGKFI